MSCCVSGCSNTNMSACLHSVPLINAPVCPNKDRKCITQLDSTDYRRDSGQDTNVPSVSSWTEETEKREEMFSHSLKENSNKEESPVETSSQMKEDHNQQDAKITQPAEVSSILMSKVSVNPQCLLELFRCCSVCLVECRVTVKGSERLFSVIQDCQSCGHHREWSSHPKPAEEHHEEPFNKEHIKHEKAFQEEDEEEEEEAASYSKEEHPAEPQDEDNKVMLVPHRLKTKEVSMEIKEIIVSLRNEKKSIREIGKTLGLSKSTVAYILKKKASTGDVINRKRSGRPRKTTEEDDQIILSIMMKNPRNPVQQIRNTLKEVGREVSATTIRRKLHSLNHMIETALLAKLAKKSSSI